MFFILNSKYSFAFDESSLYYILAKLQNLSRIVIYWKFVIEFHRPQVDVILIAIHE